MDHHFRRVVPGLKLAGYDDQNRVFFDPVATSASA